ncbi:helix-turn-helix domain-containing protein [Sphingomonas sp.]|uniref:helix-turn-helix domain-containing protein n=1 Tax=Sphingomonas sp. TaxID=28214 RepID=UPI000DB6B66E|nr:helix-turn-helix domain-containing protein [Sphingomonas sp.]PZU10095.1 MAG: AraC family transcriptional regulator [Sphingomonas sp.]
MKKDIFPLFYLYGEAHRLVEDDFVHLEALDDRSRPSDWHITPHAHADLCHIFMLWEGGGSMTADGEEVRFKAPCFLLIPIATLHGFDWDDGTTGSVITMSGRYIDSLLRTDPLADTLFARSRAIALDPRYDAKVRALFLELRDELGWSVMGHRAAVDATIIALLVIAARSNVIDTREGPRPGRAALIVARFRERIEARFRLREPVSVHARALGISETALREACMRVAGHSPARLLDQRALLEARRALLYTNLSVAEVGFAVGFVDPAYFSRFFRRHVGRPPIQYRVDGGDRPTMR